MIVNRWVSGYAGNATLTAFSVINTGTLGTNQGIEGQNLALTASTVVNDSGAIRADNNATVTLNAALNNNGGLITAGNAASVLDTAATARSPLPWLRRRAVTSALPAGSLCKVWS